MILINSVNLLTWVHALYRPSVAICVQYHSIGIVDVASGYSPKASAKENVANAMRSCLRLFS